MALIQRLEIRQGQQLVMTPQLQQAIKLLQMSNMELADYIEQELEKNPLLERDESVPDERRAASDEGEAQPEPPVDMAADGESGTVSTEQLIDAGGSGDAAGEMDTDFSNVYGSESQAEAQERRFESGTPGDGMGTNIGSGAGSSARDYSFENTLSQKPNLSEHLIEQLLIATDNPVKRIIGRHLVDMLDERGYVTGNLEALADRLGTSLEEVEKTLALLQGFEPAGIFARDLQECLQLQLKERDHCDPAMVALLANLELLAARDFDALQDICGIDREDLVDMVTELKSLDPKPGMAFGDVVMQPVVPDVVVSETQEGSWMVELNTETLPRVLINAQYYGTVSSQAHNAKEKSYISECYANANWLVKSLDQRARTILKVSQEIVRQQDGFFAYGVEHLRPLNLKTVADAIKMHESTVSRVTSNKYMATPRGLYEMKYFFSAALGSLEGGASYSAETVRHRIKILIDREAVSKVLSDDRIVELLKESGVDIARRTVAKYREAMKIPSSVQRRREKKAIL